MRSASSSSVPSSTRKSHGWLLWLEGAWIACWHGPGELLVVLAVEREPVRPSPVAALEGHRVPLLDREHPGVDLLCQILARHDRQVEALLLAEVRVEDRVEAVEQLAQAREVVRLGAGELPASSRTSSWSKIIGSVAAGWRNCRATNG